MAKSPCRETSDSLNQHGYGVARHNGDGKKWLSHRWAWHTRCGPIPKGLQVLHKCDNRACINLRHLTLGTNADNVRDKVLRGRHHAARRTKCKNGHPLPKYKPGNGRRLCKVCARAAMRKYHNKNRAVRLAEWREYYYKNKDVLNAKRAERKRRTGK